MAALTSRRQQHGGRLQDWIEFESFSWASRFLRWRRWQGWCRQAVFFRLQLDAGRRQECAGSVQRGRFSPTHRQGHRRPHHDGRKGPMDQVFRDDVPKCSAHQPAGRWQQRQRTLAAGFIRLRHDRDGILDHRPQVWQDDFISKREFDLENNKGSAAAMAALFAMGAAGPQFEVTRCRNRRPGRCCSPASG